MVGGQVQRIRRDTHIVLQLGKIMDLHSLHLFLHLEENVGQHLRIVAGAVMMEILKLEIILQSIQIMPF